MVMPSHLPAPAPRGRIGIIAGSGPDAGIDLWQKLLKANKGVFGDDYRGDLDAPHVTIISEPALGLSMELAENDSLVWESLESAVRALADGVDCFAIACNTLNYYQARIEALDLPARLISVTDVVADYVRAEGLSEIALLGSKPVTDLGPWSPYRKLLDIARVEVPRDAAALHGLIYDVKMRGAGHADIADRFADILDGLESESVLLACTELPLIELEPRRHRLIDVTECLAEALIRCSLS